VACKKHSVATEVEVILRPTVSRPVCLGVRHPRTRDQFFFLLEIFFRQLRVCYFAAHTLKRGRVCNLLLLLDLASAVPWDSRPYFIILFLRFPQPGGPGTRIYIPQEQGGPRYTPGHWVPFPSPLTTRRATVEVFSPASTWERGDCILWQNLYD
jgi:hypothetical protein